MFTLPTTGSDVLSWNRLANARARTSSAMPFNDRPDSEYGAIASTSPAYHQILRLWQHGIIEGFTDGTLRPGAEITRAETEGKCIQICCAQLHGSPNYPGIIGMADSPSRCILYIHAKSSTITVNSVKLSSV